MLDVCLVIMICGLIGARALHVFYEEWGHYKSAPLEIFKIWQGGFVYYGGFLGALLGAAILLRIKKEPFLKWADFFAPVIAFGYALGRIGCFLNGCCFGQACVGDTCSLPWMIEFTYPGLPSGFRHPTQLYAVFTETLALVILLVLEKRRVATRAGGGSPKVSRANNSRDWLTQPGTIFFAWLTLHSLGRLLMEHYREDYRGPELMGMSLSEALSYALILVTFLVVVFKFLTSRRAHHSP